MTLRLCAQNNAACIFRLYPAVLAAQTGYSARAVDSALAALEAGAWIYRGDGLVWLRNGLRYDPQMHLADDKHRKAVERAIAALPHSALVARFCDYYRIVRPLDDPSEALARGREGPSPPKPIPRPKPNPKPKADTEAEAEAVDSVDNPPGARPGPASIRSALALDSDEPGHQRTGGVADGTGGQKPPRGLTVEEDRARLEALRAHAASEEVP